MRVALDGTPLVEPAGGIRRYTVELTRALADLYPEDVFTLVSDQPVQPPPGLPFQQGAGRWWSFGLPRWLRRQQIDLFHGVDFAVPYWPNRPSVLTLHDLSPWRSSTAGAASARVRRRTPALLRFGLATMVITPSQAIRQEAIDHFGLPPEEVVAIPEAAAAIFRPRPGPPPATPYFLHIGALSPRKNVAVIIDAWRQLRRTHNVDLFFAGRAPHPRPEGPVYLGEVPEDRLAELLSSAVALLYPSTYEGFGLPVLEAMQSATPVICSLDPALCELSSGACLHAGADWLTPMRQILDRPELRAAHAAAGLKRAADFSWKRTAEQTYRVYQTALRRFHG